MPISLRFLEWGCPKRGDAHEDDDDDDDELYSCVDVFS